MWRRGLRSLGRSNLTVMPRPSSRLGASPDVVIAAVEERFGLEHAPAPDTTADDVLPLDLMADLVATRAAITRLRG